MKDNYKTCTLYVIVYFENHILTKMHLSQQLQYFLLN